MNTNLLILELSAKVSISFPIKKQPVLLAVCIILLAKLLPVRMIRKEAFKFKYVFPDLKPFASGLVYQFYERLV